MVVCRFFFQGECRYGENCRFDHQFPSGVTANQPFQSNQPQNQTFASKLPNEIDTNTLITSVRNDMLSLEKNGQWLLTCYAPFKEKQIFPGFQDQSFEEVRLGCYEAQKNNTLEQYKQQLHQALLEAKTKFKALQNPAKEIVELLRNIYNTPPANSTNSNSIFENKSPLLSSPFSGNTIFKQQNSGSIFGQQNATGSVFGQQQQTSPFRQNSLFTNTNKSVFSTTNTAQSGNGLFDAAPKQTNIFQTNQAQGIFSGGNQPQPNQPSNIFAANIPSQPFQNASNSFSAQIPSQDSPFNQVNKNQNIFTQGVAPTTFPPQNTPFNNQNTQSSSVFMNQNSQTNSIFNQNTNTVFNTQQPGANPTQIAQTEPAKSIFGNTNQMTGSIFGGANASVNMDAYSKIEDLTEADINWFKSNDLNIEKIPDKPPTYEMCFN